ncbi:MAG: AraC family transcriptional regulator [Bacteroidales bacterium]|nr:AraC family transcriptional regulator [Bacteroidales bacterium]
MKTQVIKLNEEPANKKRTGSSVDKRTKNTSSSQIELSMEYTPAKANIILDKTHRSIDHTIIFLSQGSMDLEVSLIKFHLEKNSLLMIPANSVIATNSFSPDCQYRLLTFPTFAVSPNDLIGYEPLLIDIEEPHASTTDNYFQMIEMLIRDATEEYSNCVTHAVTSFIYFINKINELTLQSKGLLDLPNPQKIKSEFLYMLNQNPHPIRTISYYTDRLNITPTYLNNVMKKMTGMSTSEWINKTTVRAARELLSDPKNYTVAQVAAELHCGSEANFSKFFKHHTGESPSEFRKRILNQ